MRKYLLALLTLLGMAPIAYAQQAVQQQPSHLDAATVTQSTTAAVNTAATLTLPAVAGKYHQISLISLMLCQDTTASTSLQLAVTSSNLGGWNTQIGQASAAGSCSQFTYQFPLGLMSSATGTATTIVIPQPGAHGAPIINAFYSVVAGVPGNQ